MDDFLIFAADKPRLHATLATVRTFLRTTLHLDLKEQAVCLAPVTQGIPFLGCRIFPGLIRLDSRTWARVRRRIRGLEATYRRGLIDEATLVRGHQYAGARAACWHPGGAPTVLDRPALLEKRPCTVCLEDVQ
jgi:hypothetical protein